MTQFKRIYVIGAGATPLHCLELLLARGRQCIFLDTGSHYSPFVASRLKELGAPLFNVSLHNLFDFFRGNESTLVFSAGNLLVFPEELIKLPNVTIFNYHNSLLPLHKGVNAEAWAIYEGDLTTGVTWHKVEKDIDSGAILARKEFLLPEEMTSGELLKKQSGLALKLLEDSLNSILSGTFSLKKQPAIQGSFHKLSERPNNGILFPEWDSAKIWRFLRSYDYGISGNLGIPAIYIDGKLYGWRRYQKDSTALSFGCQFPDTLRVGDIILQDLYPLPARPDPNSTIQYTI